MVRPCHVFVAMTFPDGMAPRVADRGCHCEGMGFGMQILALHRQNYMCIFPTSRWPARNPFQWDHRARAPPVSKAKAIKVQCP